MLYGTRNIWTPLLSPSYLALYSKCWKKVRVLATGTNNLYLNPKFIAIQTKAKKLQSYWMERFSLILLTGVFSKTRFCLSFFTYFYYIVRDRSVLMPDTRAEWNSRIPKKFHNPWNSDKIFSYPIKRLRKIFAPPPEFCKKY